jgi:hypothetical protein
MPTVEERLAMLEGRMDGMGDVRTLIASLGDQMNRGFEGLRAEMRDLRGEMNRRFEQIDRRFEHLDRRITTVDEKNDRHFTWVVGLQLTMMVAVVGVLLAAYLR